MPPADRRNHRALAPTTVGKLEAEPSLAKVRAKIEMPLVPVLLRNRALRGRWFDASCWQSNTSCGDKRLPCSAKAFELAGEEVRIWFTQAVGNQFCYKSRHPVISKDRNGPALDAEQSPGRLPRAGYPLPSGDHAVSHPEQASRALTAPPAETDQPPPPAPPAPKLGGGGPPPPGGLNSPKKP